MDYSDLIVGSDGLARPVWASKNELLRMYYDTEWGLPVKDETGLFERISLEAFQSGLSWEIILRKRDGFREAFDNFVPDIVARYNCEDVTRLLTDDRIVRNRAKIEATINNAQAVIRLRESGGLANLVWSFKPAKTPRPRTLAQIPTRSPKSEQLAKTLKAAGFSFVGPTTMFALMEAIGMIDTHLVGSHRRGSSGEWPDSN